MKFNTKYSAFPSQTNNITPYTCMDESANKSQTRAQTFLCWPTTTEKRNVLFVESDQVEVKDELLSFYTNIAESYGVLEYFKHDQNVLRYVRIAMTNDVENWFNWVCKCFRHEKFRNKVIGVIDNEKDSQLIEYLKQDPKCCYLALRRGCPEAYICYIEFNGNKCTTLRTTFDALADEAEDAGYNKRPFKCIEAVLDRINSKRSDEFKLTRLIKSTAPFEVRDIF